MLFVVAGRTFGGHCLSSMLDFDAICRARAHLALIELPSEVDFECYLSCLELLLEVQSVFFNIFLMILRLSLKSLIFLIFFLEKYAFLEKKN